MSREYATPKDRAIAALKEFQRIQPTLSGYARAFTGKPGMRIIPAVGPPSTDGKAIYYQPPLKLADNIPHKRGKCNQWDAFGIQECPACMLRHDILFDVMHEIGHVVEGSVTPLDDSEKAWAVMTAAAILGQNPRTRSMAEQIEKLARKNRHSWLHMAGTISPFMSTLVNAFEDARINHKIGLSRPGVRRMRISNEVRLSRDGIESFDPVTGEAVARRYNEMPFNHQAMVGLYVLAVGDEIADDMLDTRVTDALKDDRIVDLCSQALEKATPKNSYISAIQAFVILREYGFFVHHTDEFEEPEPEPELPAFDEDDDDADEDADDDDFPSLNKDPQEGDDGDDEDESDDELEGEEDEFDEDELDSDEGEDDDEVEGNNEADDGDEDDDFGAASGSFEADDSDELDDDEGDDGELECDEESTPEDDEELEDFKDQFDPGEGQDQDSWFGGDGGLNNKSEDSETELEPEDDSTSDDFDDDNLEGSSSDDEPLLDSPAHESRDIPPGDDEVDAELGDDADESREDEREPSDDSSDSEPGDPSDVEDEFEGGSQDESEAEESSEEDSSLAGGDQAEGEGGSESGGADEDDGDDELAEGGEGDESGSSGLDEGEGSDGGGAGESEEDGEGEGESEDEDGDGNELTSGTESLSQTDTGDTGGHDGEAPKPPEESPDEGTPEPKDWGDSQGADNLLDQMLGHSHHEDDDRDPEEKMEEDEAMEAAIMSSNYFDTSPMNIVGVRVHREGDHKDIAGVDMALAWTHAYDSHGGYYSRYSRRDLGIDCPEGEEFRPTESIVGATLLNARLAFTANQRSRAHRGLKSGKVDRRALGKRAPFDDPRVFQKTTRPGKRSYFVCIGMDVSGSTRGKELLLEKKAVMAEAEVLGRLGINFAVYAHSAKSHPPAWTDLSMDIYEIKAPDEPWNNSTRHRLVELGPDGGNVDGHTLEFYRKVLDGRKETDKILQYYTDGAMPAANAIEELEVMKRNIKVCKDRGYTLMAVGIGTDSPVAHGFDTVRVDEVGDVSRVVQHLGKRLQ